MNHKLESRLLGEISTVSDWEESCILLFYLDKQHFVAAYTMHTKINMGRIKVLGWSCKASFPPLSCSNSTFLQSTTHREVHFPKPDASYTVFQFLQKKDDFCLAFTQPVDTTKVIFPIRTACCKAFYDPCTHAEKHASKIPPVSPDGQSSSYLLSVYTLDSGKAQNMYFHFSAPILSKIWSFW